MKTTKKIVAMLMLFTLIFSGTAFANGDPLESSTTAGMTWLAEQQDLDNGSWDDHVAKTGLALLKFETHAWDTDKMSPLNPEYEYNGLVVAGLEYLFEQAQIDATGPFGDADSNGNGQVIYFGSGDNYDTAIALMAIAASGEPDEPITGPLAPMTYEEIAQDTVDYLAWGQNDPIHGNYRGGWGYNANYGWSDNSNSGYVTMGLAFSKGYGFNCTIPTFVYTELNLWIDYIQSSDGGSGYSDPEYWENILKTGNLLQQMQFVSDGLGVVRVQDAIGYIEDNWNTPVNWWGSGIGEDGGWQAGIGEPNAHYQATFTMMKGLEVYNIDLLDLDGVGDPDDWFDEVAAVLIAEQELDGSWPDSYWGTYAGGDRILSTTWALLTLQKVSPPPSENIDINIKPGSFPNAIKAKSKGVLPVALLGNEDFDVTTVDFDTVRLTIDGSVEIAPLRWAYEDVADDATLIGDGYIDIIFHFDMAEFMTLFVGDPEGNIDVKLTGADVDGFELLGSDTITIVPK